MLFDELLPIQATEDGVRLYISVTPKASANKIGKTITNPDGTNMLKVYVTAAPEAGKANAAVINLLAKTWGLAKSDFSVIKGKTERRKILQIRGDSNELLKLMKTCL